MFRTALTTTAAPFQISHTDPVLLVGSCFTEHIGERLRQAKFEVLNNPLGVIYNPVSLAKTLDTAAIEPTDLIDNQGLWHHWDCHGSFSHPDRDVVVQRVEQARRDVDFFLQKTHRVVLTLGTAEVFEWRDSGRVVANCHKVLAAQFTHRRLSVNEAVESLTVPLQRLHDRQPDLRVVLTVSPVRHLRNGAVENQRSKATLVLACAELAAQLPWVHYFPAYELLLDDLRDYRFYAADMLHPSEVAVDYIWQHFSDTYFDAATVALCRQVAQVQAAARHRPFNPDTPQHRAFVERQLTLIAQLEQTHPTLDFAEERFLLQ